MAAKRFSKEKWLEKANAQIEQGFLSERERNDALELWVKKFDGKSYEEIVSSGNKMPDDYFVIN